MGHKTYLNQGRTTTTPSTPQAKKARKDQVKNQAGGYVFEVSNFEMLKRFLILGTEGNTYYATEQKMTETNARNVLVCLQQDPKRTIDMIVEISKSGRAPKNDPALFALAMAASFGGKNEQHADTRRYALSRLPEVARTGTHLFHFIAYVDSMRGWGNSLRAAVAAWYNGKQARDLAYQVVKYQQRDGWSHRDLLRKAHVRPEDPAHDAIYAYVAQGKMPDATMAMEGSMTPIIGFEKAKRTQHAADVVSLIKEYRLTREMLQTQHLNYPDVWMAMLESGMPMTALIRNLGKLSNIGLLSYNNPQVVKMVIEQITNPEAIQRARVHPIQILSAYKVYGQGRGERGSLSWTPVKDVQNALDAAFYLAFGNVEKTGLRHFLGIDVSGSMGILLPSVPGLTARDGAAVMAMATLNAEGSAHTYGFTSSGGGWYRSGTVLSDLGLKKGMKLNTVIRLTSNLNFGSTDCALPMLFAMENNIPVDVFSVYTDHETWAGSVHPYQALRQYREKMGIPAKLVVVGMTATNFTIADPKDPLMLDVVGFDTATPQAIAEFGKMGIADFVNEVVDEAVTTEDM